MIKEAVMQVTILHLTVSQFCDPEQKDWNGKRDCNFYNALMFRFLNHLCN